MDKENKEKRRSRNIVVIVCFLPFILIYIFGDIQKPLYYFVCVGLLIYGGVKTPIDYYYKLPMRVGYSGDIPYLQQNLKIRIVLLLLGIFTSFIGLYGIIYIVNQWL